MEMSLKYLPMNSRMIQYWTMYIMKLISTLATNGYQYVIYKTFSVPDVIGELKKYSRYKN